MGARGRAGRSGPRRDGGVSRTRRPPAGLGATANRNRGLQRPVGGCSARRPAVSARARLERCLALAWRDGPSRRGWAPTSSRRAHGGDECGRHPPAGGAGGRSAVARNRHAQEVGAAHGLLDRPLGLAGGSRTGSACPGRSAGVRGVRRPSVPGAPLSGCSGPTTSGGAWGGPSIQASPKMAACCTSTTGGCPQTGAAGCACRRVVLRRT